MEHCFGAGYTRGAEFLAARDLRVVVAVAGPAAAVAPIALVELLAGIRVEVYAMIGEHDPLSWSETVSDRFNE